MMKLRTLRPRLAGIYFPISNHLGTKIRCQTELARVFRTPEEVDNT